MLVGKSLQKTQHLIGENYSCVDCRVVDCTFQSFLSDCFRVGIRFTEAIAETDFVVRFESKEVKQFVVKAETDIHRVLSALRPVQLIVIDVVIVTVRIPIIARVGDRSIFFCRTSLFSGLQVTLRVVRSIPRCIAGIVQRHLLVENLTIADSQLGFQGQTVVNHIIGIGAQREAVVIISLDGTIFGIVVTGDIGLDFVVTVFIRHIIILSEGVLRRIVPPIEIPVFQIGLERVLVGQRTRIGIGGNQIIIIFGSVHHFQVAFLQLRDTELGGSADLRSTSSGTFGSDLHNTIGTTRTVKGCGRTVFQDRDALDVVRVEVGKRIAHYTVNYPQRFLLTTDRPDTTHTDTYSRTRLTGSRRNHHTSHFTLKHVGYTGSSHILQFVGLHRSDGTRDRAFTLHTVTYYHNLVQCLRVGSQLYDHLFRSLYHIFIQCITDERHHQRGALRNT